MGGRAVWSGRHAPRWARVAVLTAAIGLVASAPAGSSRVAIGWSVAPRPFHSIDVEASRARPLLLDAPTAPSDDVAIAPPPETFDASPAPAAPPPAMFTASSSPGPSGGVWAVVIGIDDYPGSGSDLRSAVNDANDVDAALGAYGVTGDRRLVLRNTQASAAMIAESMRWLVDRAGPSSTAVFFYAGHVRKLGAGSEAIVAADGRLVTDAAMAELLRPLAARQTWIGLASCYAGGFTEVLAPGRILTAAADATHLAYENESFHRSYLVEYMVRRAMIQGEAPASVEQSFAWAADALRRDYPNRIPVQYDQLDGELRLGTPPPSSSPPSPPPPPPPPPSNGGFPPPPSSDEPKDPPDDDGDCVITIGSLIGCDD